MASPDGLICHPGTHNKWVVVGNGRILSFRTAMTGELFGLLQKHSILSEMLKEQGHVDAAFRRGVRHALAANDLLAELFSIRPRVLLKSEEHTSELQSLMRISYAVFCLKKKKNRNNYTHNT